MASSLSQRTRPSSSRRVSPWLTHLPRIGSQFLEQLVGLGLVPSEAVHSFLEERLGRLPEYTGEVEVGRALIDAGLLTSFQLDRVLAGHTHGLTLGNYRLLDQIGSGGMGLVFLGEHRLMKRRVAIKVLPVDDDCDHNLRQRFYGEMKLLAELNHPNIVQAFDAGEVAASGPHLPALTYLVMELIAGGDLEHYVEKNGPIPIARACDWGRQAAQGLQAAHDLHVVHRDVKPSNLLLTTRGNIKLVDFGLAHQFCSQLTDPRALLGSVEFMAPEQSHDPTSVGPEADVYGLAATLFWLLTGETPYPYSPNIGSALRSLQTNSPRRLSDLRPDVPPDLDDLVDRMLNRDPSTRPTPLAISTVLAALADAESGPAEGSPEQLRSLVEHYERSLEASRTDLREAHDAILFAMAKMAESRDGETPGHLRRLQRYVTTLAREASRVRPWTGLVDDRFLAQLQRCVVLHDIGKIGLPDDILLKPAALSEAERRLVQAHPLVGDRILEALAEEHGTALDFLAMARDIVRHHHERWDGNGYPDRLAEEAIPAVARLTAVADVYDALRRERMHKPALNHARAVTLILRHSPGQFDPVLLDAFTSCHEQFDRIYSEVGE